MAISTYTELKASIASWLNRDDLTATIPDFIALAESSINRDVRHWRMEKRTTLTISSQYTALPTDWLEAGRLTVQGDGTSELELVSLSELADMRAWGADSTGRPAYYAINGSDIEVSPSPDSAYTVDLIYTARTAALSDTNETNWLLTYAPDVYLYASLIHTAPYLAEDERASTWAAFYKSSAAALNKDSRKAKVGGSGMRMKVKSYQELRNGRYNNTSLRLCKPRSGSK